MHELDSDAGKSLIQSTRDSLNADGSCTLEQFVTKAALKILADQANSLKDLAFPGPTSVTPYFFNYRLGEGMEVDETHPIKRTSKRNLSQVAGDLIPSDHLLRILFELPLMTDFLGRVLEVPVYRNQDKYQALNISMMKQGGCQQWHFDSGNMVTTLLLQAPESGGDFEYVPNIRSNEDENFDEVKKVMGGNSDRVKKLELKPGMLSIFRGHYSLHHVTEVLGSKKRIQAILGYTTEPNLVGSLDSSILHYGPRVAELEGVGQK